MHFEPNPLFKTYPISHKHNFTLLILGRDETRGSPLGHGISRTARNHTSFDNHPIGAVNGRREEALDWILKFNNLFSGS